MSEAELPAPPRRWVAARRRALAAGAGLACLAAAAVLVSLQRDGGLGFGGAGRVYDASTILGKASLLQEVEEASWHRGLVRVFSRMGSLKEEGGTMLLGSREAALDEEGGLEAGHGTAGGVGQRSRAGWSGESNGAPKIDCGDSVANGGNGHKELINRFHGRVGRGERLLPPNPQLAEALQSRLGPTCLHACR